LILNGSISAYSPFAFHQSLSVLYLALYAYIQPLSEVLYLKYIRGIITNCTIIYCIGVSQETGTGT